MKTILGLDLGTNSIGWSVIKRNYDNTNEGFLGKGKILGMGCRIIPMNETLLSEFSKGNAISQTATRTEYRNIRRLRQRNLLRRDRLHRVLNILDFLPLHYKTEIDFAKNLGQFKGESEPKIAYKKTKEGKHEFIFKSSFLEMVEDFKVNQPALFYQKVNGEESKIPYDWTIYYLRKKALSHILNKEELAWLILHFNQKRGYYQLRGDEIDLAKDNTKKVEFIEALVTDVIDIGNQNKGLKKYEIRLENGLSFIKPSRKEIDWKGKSRAFIITTELDDDGIEQHIKSGEVKRTFKTVDDENDWIAIKSKSESIIKESGKTVGEFIYDSLLQNPSQKIKGKLIRTIERDFYKHEFQQILSKQIELQPSLFSPEKFTSCVKHLYASNIAHQSDLLKKDFVHLFLNDILFYQRPIKSNKSQIPDCKFEFREYVNKKTGEKEKLWLKCIAKSHPLFQEFRLWNFIQQLKIYEREKKIDGHLQTEVNVTDEFLYTFEEKEALFYWLNNRRTIKQRILIRYFKRNGKKLTEKTHRWNFAEDREYPCNETRAGFLTVLKKNETIDAQRFLTQDVEIQLWHTLYSISEKKELRSALNKLAVKLNINYTVLEPFLDFPPFKKEYGSFSYKALNKLMPLLRLGEYWNEKDIPEQSKSWIKNMINGRVNNSINNKIREKLNHFTSIEHFQGLPLELASYVTFGKLPDAKEKVFWQTPDDITLLKQHALQNPVVEQVINETLQVIKDIWEQYGKGKQNYFNEIHVELGREMKNSADKRKQMSAQNIENQNTSTRIQTLTRELMDNSKTEGVVKNYSTDQHDILKLYEESVLTATSKLPVDIEKISKKSEPNQKETQQYLLWLDQKYISPFTGKAISLSNIFSSEYQAIHILPQSRYFDDSLTNKVICESEFSSLKGNKTAYELIEKYGGEIVSFASGKQVHILTKEAYEQHIQRNYINKKKDFLLMSDIPESFTKNQLNDSRYISELVIKLLSNLVREENEEVKSRHVIPINRKVQSRLKRDWGLNNIWNELISPRFQRMNEITKSEDFGSLDEKEGNVFFRNMIPSQLRKNFDFKRIDYRCHALDALVIALSDRRHVHYLNNQHAAASQKKERMDLREKLRKIESKQITDIQSGEIKTIQIAKEFLKPWKNITNESKEKLAHIVVSVKKNKRVINKNINRYERWQHDNNLLKKYTERQDKNPEWWSIRRPLHLETIYGKSCLRFKKSVRFNAGIKDWENLVDKQLKKQIKALYKDGLDEKSILKHYQKNPYKIKDQVIIRVEIYYFDDNIAATRKPLDANFNLKVIESITDHGIQKILINHLNADEFQNQRDENGNIIPANELAFSPEGIEDLNKNIVQLNGGENHQPIYKVRRYESLGKKFPLGETKNKASKYVAAATGTNLFFAIYEGNNEHGELTRQFNTIPLNEVITPLKKGLNPVPKKHIDNHGNEYHLLFSLSPNDLVFLPHQEEIANPSLVDFNNLNKDQIARLFRMEKTSGERCYFMYNNIATLIMLYDAKSGYGEFGSQNKFEKVDGIRIKDVCWKVEVDRLGNLKKAN